MLLQLFFVIVSTRRSSSCCYPPQSHNLRPSLAKICRLRVSCSLHSNFQACVQELPQSLCWVYGKWGGGGLLYNDSGHRNQHFPAVQLEVLLSNSIPEIKIISKIKALA